jgi:histone demethylase JARID1
MPPLKRLPLESVTAATVDGTSNSPIKILGVDISSKESEQPNFSNNSCAEEVKLGRLLKKAKLPEDSELVVMNKAIGSSIWSGSRQSAG